MNPDIKKRWVAALRSGDYKQAKGTLHDPDTKGFCRLGVLCDLVKYEAGLSWTGGGSISWCDGTIVHCSGAFLPKPVVAFTGMGTLDPEVEILGRMRSLAELNDGGRPFLEIAGLIEEQL